MKKINISIDDVSPHPYSSVAVLDRCHELIEEFPDIKFSLFIPMAYWRTIKPQIATKNALFIDKFPEFCEVLNSLPKSNFEICYHGLYHGIPGKSDNDEFKELNYEQAEEKFLTMFEIARSANLSDKFEKIFRPPAWRMSHHAIKAARDLGIKVLALSPENYAKTTYNSEEEKLNDVVYYNCSPPWHPLKIYDKTEIVYHACEWDKNYFSKKLSEDLSVFLEKNKDDIEFCFLERML